MSTHLVGRKSFKPLHTNISIHIPPTLLYTFLLFPTMRICLAIISFILMISMNDSAVLLFGELDAGHS